MIDRFDRARFESVLPKDRRNGLPLWSRAGFVNGEHCYCVHVKPGVLIYIRSTLRIDNLAADTAKDSIRCWLASNPSGTPLGSKDQRWIARTNGWDRRLTETLRKLWRFGRQLEPCNRCGGATLALKTRGGENAGRWFRKCSNCEAFLGWMKEEKESK